MSRPDPRLIELALDDIDGAVDQLARAWLPIVYRWCHKLGGRRMDTEDAAHEVLIIMCRRLDKVASAEQFPSWLYGITKRVIANHRRRAWFKRWMGAPTRDDRPASGQGPEEDARAAQERAAVWEALEALSAPHREVLVLCELEERPGSEVAQLTGLPLGTVKSRLRAAKAAFRQQIEHRAAGHAAAYR